MQSQESIERTPSDGAAAAEFTATVTEIRELSRIAGTVLFQLALDHTAFQAPRNGAAGILGEFVAVARGGAVLRAPVLDVTRDAAGDIWHTTAKPLQPGTAVTARVFAQV